MTTYYEEVEVVTTEKIVVCTQCDWCGEEIDTEEQLSNVSVCVIGAVDVDITPYDINSPIENVGWRVDDLCVNCWIRLRDALTGLGVKCVDN